MMWIAVCLHDFRHLNQYQNGSVLMDMVNILASLNGESQGKRDFGTSFWNPAKEDIHVNISDQLDSLFKNSIFFSYFHSKVYLHRYIPEFYNRVCCYELTSE